MSATAGLPIKRNTAILSACVAVQSAVLQLVAAISTLTFALVTGIERLLGLGPAIFLTAAALTALPAGRTMDRVGRVPVLAGGFGLGIAGCIVTGIGVGAVSTVTVIVGFVLIGSASGTLLLLRTAAGDMYPPERRARGIAYALSGAVFGAVLGPAVFGPIFSGRDLEASALRLPWFAASGLMAVGLVLVLTVRPDPKRIAERLAPPPAGELAPPAAPLGELLRRPGVVQALLAAVASFAVMVSVMNLTGYVVVEEHRHHQSSVFPIIGAHVLGMYGLVLVIGNVIDRIGRTPALVGGLLVMAASCLGLTWAEGVGTTAFLLFGLGLGWNLSFVAASAQLVDAAAPAERGRLLGFGDLLAGLLGATLALLGGLALGSAGVIALAVGATVIALVPVLPILLRSRPARPAVPQAR